MSLHFFRATLPAFPLAKRVTAVRACRGFSLRLKHNKAPLGIGYISYDKAGCCMIRHFSKQD